MLFYPPLIFIFPCNLILKGAPHIQTPPSKLIAKTADRAARFLSTYGKKQPKSAQYYLLTLTVKSSSVASNKPAIGRRHISTEYMIRKNCIWASFAIKKKLSQVRPTEVLWSPLKAFHHWERQRHVPALLKNVNLNMTETQHRDNTNLFWGLNSAFSCSNCQTSSKGNSY